jgi:hypothetical protein
MFRALLAHPQEVLHKRHLVYCVCVMSVGCSRFGVELVSSLYLAYFSMLRFYFLHLGVWCTVAFDA